MADRSAPPAADHDRHDPLRVAEAADRGGRLPADLAACPACVALHAELVALAAALPEAALPARPRDFRLTPADAARLRGWRRWWDAVGTSRDVLTRPLAIGLTTLGLAGLLVSAVPSVLPFGSAASAPAPELRAPAQGLPAASGGRSSLQAAAPSAAATAPAGVAGAAPVPSLAPAASSGFGAAIPDASTAPVDTSAGGAAAPIAGPSGAPSARTNDTAAEGGPLASEGAGDELAKGAVVAGPSVPPVAVVSTILLLLGLALAAIRRLAHRGTAVR